MPAPVILAVLAAIITWTKAWVTRLLASTVLRRVTLSIMLHLTKKRVIVGATRLNSWLSSLPVKQKAEIIEASRSFLTAVRPVKVPTEIAKKIELANKTLKSKETTAFLADDLLAWVNSIRKGYKLKPVKGVDKLGLAFEDILAIPVMSFSVGYIMVFWFVAITLFLTYLERKGYIVDNPIEDLIPDWIQHYLADIIAEENMFENLTDDCFKFNEETGLVEKRGHISEQCVENMELIQAFIDKQRSAGVIDELHPTAIQVNHISKQIEDNRNEY